MDENQDLNQVMSGFEEFSWVLYEEEKDLFEKRSFQSVLKLFSSLSKDPDNFHARSEKNLWIELLLIL